MSLKTRLISAAALWIVIGLVLAGVLLSAIFRQHVTVQFYDELHVHLKELERLVHTSPDGLRLDRPLSDPRYEEANSGYYWEIKKGSQVLARSASLAGPVLPLPNDQHSDVGVHHYHIHGPTGALLVAEKSVWPTASAAPLQFAIGTDKRHLDGVIAGFNLMLFWSLGAFAATMILASVALIAFALNPLKQLQTALAHVRSGETQQLAGRFPLEVQPLVDELNGLLDSTAQLVQRARTQAGNMAHGLKTSLAILTDEAATLKSQGVTRTADTLMTQCRRMQAHIDYQIARARAVAMRSVPGTIASGAKVAGDIMSALRRLHADRNLTCTVDLADDLTVAVDPQDLSEMLANLADNACIYARAQVKIRQAEPTRPGFIAIVIEDDGPGLPPEAYEAVFIVGERWDSRKPGSGLGLTIVRDLARLYGGDVALGRSGLGGLEVVLLLPAPTPIAAARG
ncbi:MAG: ATP-binding protein [Hyphomicrobiaceae bacterium]